MLPETKLGWWPIGLSIAFVVLTLMKIKVLIPMPTFVIAALELGGFSASIVAFFKNRDRAILNVLPIIIGVVVVVWTAAELLSSLGEHDTRPYRIECVV